MKSFRPAIVIAVAIFCFCRVSAAQNVYGSTTIDIDPDSGIVTATCETDFDGALDGNYQAEVTCTVTDQNGAQVAFGSALDVDGDLGYAQAVVTFSGTPGSTYTATGIHRAFAVLEVQQFLKTVYEDPFNFGNSFESVDGDNYPDYYDWFGPGPEQQTKTNSIRLGRTQDTKHYPKATISFNFTPNGSKNSQDLLSFLAYTTGECSELLGPAPCSTFWRYNLEGSVTVSDDASLWTLTQQKSSIIISGASKDSGGTLHPFSKIVTFSDPNDTPDANHLQATSGSKTIFWIDAPGRARIWDDGNEIDSLNWLQSYSVTVCSTVMPSICSTAAWYVQLIVNSGGQLSNSSVANMGSPN